MAYIDSSKLIEEIESLRITVGGESIFSKEAKDSILRIINEQPEVCVNCLECDYYYSYYSKCLLHSEAPFKFEMNPKDFCSYSKRKIDNE